MGRDPVPPALVHEFETQISFVLARCPEVFWNSIEQGFYVLPDLNIEKYEPKKEQEQQQHSNTVVMYGVQARAPQWEEGELRRIGGVIGMGIIGSVGIVLNLAKSSRRGGGGGGGEKEL